MSQIKAKQVKKILAASIKVTGVSVTASNSSKVVTTDITSALTIAGDGSTAVSLTVSTAYNIVGVITNTPLNKCEIYNNTTKKKIASSTGDEVYGRMTQSGGIYTLSFFYLNAGIETAYLFPSNSTIDFDFNYRFDFHQISSDALISQIARNVYQDVGGVGGGILKVEQLTVLSLDTLPALQNTPSDVTTMFLIVNGQSIDSLGGGSAAYTVSGGVNIAWSYTNAGYHLETTDRVIAKYLI